MLQPLEYLGPKYPNPVQDPFAGLVTPVVFYDPVNYRYD